MQRAIKEDTTFVATYEKKKYKIRFYDPEGSFMMTNETPFGEDAVTDEVTEELASRGFINAGKVVKGWTVIRVADDESEANVHAVDSNMHVQAVCAWDNPDLPVVVEITGAVKPSLDEDGDIVFKPPVKITTNEERKTEIYLIATLKGTDEESGAEKALYMDRRVFSVPKGETGLVLNASGDAHDFDLPIEPQYADAVSKLELVALEKKQNGTTGSTYSNVAECSITRDFGFTKPSTWSTTKPEEKEGRIITSKTQYSYRDKEYVYSGQETYAGYTKEGSESLGTSYTDWYMGSGSNDVKRYDQYKEVITAENKAAYKSFCKICSCGKWAWNTKSGKCSYCGTNTITNRKLKVFSSQKLSGTKESGTGNGGGAYRYGKTVTYGQTYSGIGYVYRITYGHDNIQILNSFTSKNAKGYLFLWQDDNGESQPYYRLKTEKIRNKFYRYKEWSNETHLDPDSEKAWSDTQIQATSTRQVRTRTVYQYQDKIDAPELITDMQGEVRTVEGNLKVDENLDGKKGTVMVYQANNTDPNKYQMQYTGQITFRTDEENPDIGKNAYSFSFIPKDEPDKSTGNYVVSIGVEGMTGLVTVGIIEAPKEKHTVKVFYQENDSAQGGTKQVVVSEQEVEDGGDVDMNEIEIPERNGYYFAGLDKRTTNITEDCSIELVYLPVQNAVVFVDWINQTIDLRTAVTGEEIILPVIDSDEESPYKFRGWKKEDGSSITGETVTVEGNMVITADYEPSTFNVRFIGVDGDVIDTQNVEYHQSANPPEYSVPEGTGVFAGWSTDVNWWNVEEDVDVRPIIVHDEQALAPAEDIIVDEETGERRLILETEEEGADIYYTTDGTVPTEEMIQEYLQTSPAEYSGSILKYTEPITFPSEESGGQEPESALTEMNINAVTYVEGKDVSEGCNVTFEKEPDLDEVVDYEEFAGWEEIGEYDVKAKADKSVQIKIDLEENPGLTGYDFLIEADKSVFYPDSDEYGDPSVEPGECSEQGTMMTSDLQTGWRVNWNSTEANTQNGRLFTMPLHVDEEAEEGTYPISVSYAPEGTLDENFDATELESVKVSVDSEASIPIDTLEATLSRTSYVYEGEAFEPTVKIEGLKEDTDFTVKYEDNTDVGTAKAIVTGMGDYAGTVEKEFTITQANIANADIAAIEDIVKTGEAIEPEIPITFNGKELEKDKDYEATFTDNVEVGTATVEIRGIGNFKGTTETQFNIIETLESRLAEAERKLAEAEAAKAEAEARIEELTQAKEDAEAEATAAKAAQQQAEADAQAAREAMENAQSEAEAAELAKQVAEAELAVAQAAKATAEAEANTAKIAQQQAEARAEAAEAEKSALEAQLTAAQSAKEAAELQSQLDKAAKEAAEAQVVAAQAAQAAAEAREQAATRAKEAAEAQAQDAQSRLTQTEAELAEAIAAKQAAEADANASEAAKQAAEARVAELTEAKEKAEADLIEANAAKAAAETALEQAQNDKDAAAEQIAQLIREKEELEKQLAEAKKISIAGAEVEGIKPMTYTGKELKQAPTVTVKGKRLTEGKDYTISYRNNIEVGMAVMMIEGTGEYKEDVTRTFPINPAGTTITKCIKGSKKATVKWKKQATQTTGYQIRYSMKKNFKSGVKTVNITTPATTKKVIKKLKTGKKYYFQIRTCKKVGTQYFYSGWSKAKAVKVK